MSVRYWKVVLRYGHVGHRNEVSIARYLVFPLGATIQNVIAAVKKMPGTKNNGIDSIQEISYEEYVIGKRNEQENFYLQNLFNQSSA